MKSFAEWTVWVIVFLASIFFTLPINPQDEAAKEKFGNIAKEYKVLSWLFFAGCIATLKFPLSKFHLLWWVIAATIVWIIMVFTGQKITFLGLTIFWIYRFNILGWEALTGNLRITALVIAIIGLAGVILGPTQSIGKRSKRASGILLAFGTLGFLVIQLF